MELNLITTNGFQSGVRVYSDINHLLKELEGILETTMAHFDLEITAKGIEITYYDLDDGKDEKRSIDGLSSLDTATLFAFGSTYDQISIVNSIYIDPRDLAIVELTAAINCQEGTNLRPEQVEHWVGSSVHTDTIKAYSIEISVNPSVAVKADDVLGLWDAHELDVLRNLSPAALASMDIDDLSEFLTRNMIDARQILAAYAVMELRTHNLNGGLPMTFIAFDGEDWTGIADGEIIDLKDKDHVIAMLLAFAASNGDPCSYLATCKQPQGKLLAAIQELTDTFNKYHHSKFTVEQMAKWAGDDVKNINKECEIIEKSQGNAGAQLDDIWINVAGVDHVNRMKFSNSDGGEFTYFCTTHLADSLYEFVKNVNGQIDINVNDTMLTIEYTHYDCDDADSVSSISIDKITKTAITELKIFANNKAAITINDNRTTDVVDIPSSTIKVTTLNGEHAGSTSHLTLEEFIEGYQDVLGDRGVTKVTICANSSIVFIDWYNGFMDGHIFEVIARNNITEENLVAIEEFANSYQNHEMASITFTHLKE